MRTFLPALLLLTACASTPVPESALARVDDAAHLLEAGRLDDAEATFRLALELHPHVPAAHAGLGIVALSRNDLVAAEEHLRAAVEIDEDFAIAWSNRGVVAERRGDLEAAQRYYERALSILPLFPEARRNLVLLLLGLDQPAAARAHAMRLVQVTDDEARDVSLLALCELGLGRPHEARARLDSLGDEHAAHAAVRVVRGLIAEADPEGERASLSAASLRPQGPARRAAP
jgi:Tfp pilus assembly protein PilF